MYIRTPHKTANGKIFAWMALITGLGIGIINPIFPNFVETFLKGDKNVSIFFLVISFITFIASLLSPLIFRSIKRSYVALSSFIILGLTFFLFTLSTKIVSLSILSFSRVFFEIVIWICLGLFVRDFANKNDIGSEEGLYYKYQNIGFFIGPLIGGFLSARFGYEIVFITGAAVLFSALGYFFNTHNIKKHPSIVDRKTESQNLIFNIKTYFQNPGRLKAYVLMLIFMSWIGFRRVYVPLYVINSGYLSSVTGIIFALSMAPLILLEEKVGKYADKKGLKMPISTGYLILAITFLTIFISPFPILNFILIIAVNIGGAMIEPLVEPYLFKSMSVKEEESLYGIFMTAHSVAFFLSPTIGSLILIFLPFKFLFLGFGLIFLSTYYFVRKYVT